MSRKAWIANRHRNVGGRKRDLRVLDVTWFGAGPIAMRMLANLGASYLVTRQPPRRLGNAHQNIVPYQVFEAADGHMILAVGNDGQFAKFCAVAGRPDLAADARFATNAGRVRHREQLVPIVAGLMRTRIRADWLAALEAAKVPCGPINDLAEVFADPQVRDRGMTTTMPHPLAGVVELVASPIKLAATPPSMRRAPPLLGQQTDEVLAEFGLGADEIAALRAAGAI